MATPDVLRKAANIIEQRGHYRGADVCSRDGVAVCASGAIRLALGHTVSPSPSGLMHHMAPPTSWDQSDFEGFRIGYALALETASTFVQHKGYVPDADLDNDHVPAIIFFNDKTAPNGPAVVQVLRDAADWFEQPASDLIASVEAKAVERAERVLV